MSALKCPAISPWHRCLWHFGRADVRHVAVHTPDQTNATVRVAMLVRRARAACRVAWPHSTFALSGRRRRRHSLYTQMCGSCGADGRPGRRWSGTDKVLLHHRVRPPDTRSLASGCFLMLCYCVVLTCDALVCVCSCVSVCVCVCVCVCVQIIRWPVGASSPVANRCI